MTVIVMAAQSICRARVGMIGNTQIDYVIIDIYIYIYTYACIDRERYIDIERERESICRARWAW